MGFTSEVAAVRPELREKADFPYTTLADIDRAVMTIHLQGAILPLGDVVFAYPHDQIAQRRNVVELSFGVIKARFEYVL